MTPHEAAAKSAFASIKRARTFKGLQRAWAYVEALKKDGYIPPAVYEILMKAAMHKEARLKK
jgi:hypothetical protein